MRVRACAVGKDSWLTSRSRSGRPRSDTMKSAANGTVWTHCDNVMLVTEEESDDLELRDCKWQGWTLYLDWRGHVQDKRCAEEAHCKWQTTTSITALLVLHPPHPFLPQLTPHCLCVLARIYLGHGNRQTMTPFQ